MPSGAPCGNVPVIILPGHHTHSYKGSLPQSPLFFKVVHALSMYVTAGSEKPNLSSAALIASFICAIALFVVLQQ